MLQISKSEDRAIVTLGLKSLLAVFKDIIPGYESLPNLFYFSFASLYLIFFVYVYEAVLFNYLFTGFVHQLSYQAAY